MPLISLVVASSLIISSIHLSLRLIAHARNTPFIPIDPTENTFLDVMILLGKYGVRRVFTVDAPGGDITGVISQTMTLELIADNLEQFSAMNTKPIAELGLGNPTKVISVSLHDYYWDAFHAISNNVRSKVAITLSFLRLLIVLCDKPVT